MEVIDSKLLFEAGKELEYSKLELIAEDGIYNLRKENGDSLIMVGSLNRIWFFLLGYNAKK